MRIVGAQGRTEKTTVRTTSSASGDSEFFDSRGAAVAHFDDETMYLWSGEPVAHRDEDSLFGFSGSHLGWLHDGGVYDHDGNIVAAVTDRFRDPVQTAPFRGQRAEATEGPQGTEGR